MQRTILTATVLALMGVGGCSFQQGEALSHSFQELFEKACLTDLPATGGYAKTLSPKSEMSVKNAAPYLKSQKSRAWSVKGHPGTFTLVQSDDGSICELHSKKLDVGVLREIFEESIETAPSPYLVKENLYEVAENNPRKVLEYEWASPALSDKAVIRLATDESPEARSQATLSVILTKR